MIKRIALPILLLSFAMNAPAEEIAPSIISPNIPMSLQIYTGGRAVITIKPDGTVVIPPDVTMDEATREFWNAVQRQGIQLACPKH